MPILADVRDESADDMRMVIEPRRKNVDPEVLMGMLLPQFRPRSAVLDEHERADRRADAQGLLAQRGVCAPSWITAAKFCSAAHSTGWPRSTTALRCSKALSSRF